MSICDQIVVMKDGVLQQIGKPQDVYDDPVNLFVATFLGNPPINVFDAEVQDGKLWIGKEAVLETNAKNGPVTVAIRPEGFVPDENGGMSCCLRSIEVMGRDVSVVCDHESFTGETFRAIVDSDDLPKLTSNTVRFRLKENKVFLFNRETGERIALR